MLGSPPTIGRLFALANVVALGWTVQGGEPGRIVLGPTSDLRLECRWDRGFDVENAAEVFADQVYRMEIAGKWVVDGGSGIGDSSVYFARRGAKHVFALEPNPESHAIAARNVARSAYLGRITLRRAALGGSAGERILRFPRDVPSAASLSPTTEAEARWVFGEGVPVAVLALADTLPADDPSLGALKLDCQGAEYEIIDSTTDGTLRRFGSISIEFTAGADALGKRLRSAGFVVESDAGTRGYLRATRASPDDGAGAS